MMFIGSDEDILGLPEESKGISIPVEHSFDFDVDESKGGKNFVPSEPRKKKELKVIDKGKKDGRKQQRGKSSNLF